MRKIQLDLGTLRVESFVAADTSTESGTVQGHAVSALGRPCSGHSCGPVACPGTFDSACIC
ncbi:MAG TPA: hypothetical protein VE871_19395 [Longimicrobium sp.]|nr:hypothetical protein [Longimicrobium sp.]